MSDPSNKSPPTMLRASSNVTGSAELQDGRSHSNLHDGRQIEMFGPAPVRANPSAPQENSKDNLTNGTCGPYGSGSSESVDLQSVLVNKLAVRLPLDGWTKSLMIWKPKATPLGRQYCQLALSARRTGEIVSGLWQTPVADDAVNRTKGKFNSRGEPKLSAQVKLWPTIRATDGERGGRGDLIQAVRGNPNKHYNLFTTPCADDTGHRKNKYAQGGTALSTQAGGSLNPQWVAWLMGYPIEWVNFADSAMPSSRKPRKRS